MSPARRWLMVGGAVTIAALAGVWRHAFPDPSAGNAVIAKTFERPRGVPHPAGNPPSAAKIALGERLFNDPSLSGNGQVSCATCHNPKLGFADGTPQSMAGATGRPLRRHTPSLWNLAWAPVLYWDGRASSLEDQARFPMSHPDEMASSPEIVASALGRDPSYTDAFRAAFPGLRNITGELVLAALAAYERTLISPPTRFDAWVAGDRLALDTQQRQGFALFTGRAQCSVCHSGFAFTDHAFHDIGLPGDDIGRGSITGLAQVNHAFKTPTLRELVWTAPYMHDGSLATLEDVVGHYERGGEMRVSRSPDMPKAFKLSDDERAALVAFLETLSSATVPKPSTEAWVGRPAIPPSVVPATTRTISQRDKMFAPGAIKARKGQSITILNNDTRSHNVRIVDRLWQFNSGAQEPGESVVLKLDANGLFEAHCAIHPSMRLWIEVD